MSAVKLYDAGYTPLVSVIPPGAELSPGSRIKPAGLGKIPGKKGSRGWGGYPWTGERTPTRAEVEQWGSWGANIGVHAAHFPGLDIDVRSKRLADVVISKAENVLGPAPVRYSVDPRRLLMYRTAEPFERMALIVTHAGESHLIEMLCEGRQYLVAGTHPSGARYRWERLPGRAERLPEITREDVGVFFDELETLLRGKYGLEVERVGKGRVAQRAAPVQESLRAPSIAHLYALVERIPNPEHYGWDEWVEMGYAVKAAGAEDEACAFSAWAEWSAEHPKHDNATCEDAWSRFHPPYRVGWSWLREQAEDLSDYSSAQDEFAAYVDASAEPPAPKPETLARVKNSTEWVVQRLLRWRIA